jgi:hypothetical protein
MCQSSTPSQANDGQSDRAREFGTVLVPFVAEGFVAADRAARAATFHVTPNKRTNATFQWSPRFAVTYLSSCVKMSKHFVFTSESVNEGHPVRARSHSASHAGEPRAAKASMAAQLWISLVSHPHMPPFDSSGCRTRSLIRFPTPSSMRASPATLIRECLQLRGSPAPSAHFVELQISQSFGKSNFFPSSRR